MAAHNFGQVAGGSKASSKVSFAVGDVVNHKKFGKGTVLNVTPMPGDAMLEISFEECVKKLMLNFAHLEKL